MSATTNQEHRPGSTSRMDAKARREFESLVLPLSDNLYGAAMRFTRDPSAAEDLVQDVMIRAYRFWSTFDRSTSVKAWMFTILRNTFINEYHRRNRRRDFQNDVNSQMRSLGPTAALANSTSQPPGPEEVVSAEMTLARIREALASLPDDFRLAVTLADLEGLEYKQIADLMDCPLGTVMSRIFRGRERLHALLYGHAQEIGVVDDNDDGERRTDHSRVRQAREQEEKALLADVQRLHALLHVPPLKIRNPRTNRRVLYTVPRDEILDELAARLDRLSAAA